MSRFSMLSKLISRGYAYDYEEDASQHYFEQFNLTTNSVNAVLTHFFDNMVKIKRFLNQ